MIQNKTFYCKLENFCCLHITDKNTIIREKSIFLKNEYAYIDYLNNIASLKDRILELTKTWLVRHPNMDTTLLHEENKINASKENINSDAGEYPGFMIYNRWSENNLLGACNKGWFILESNFCNYIRQYAIDIYGISDYAKVLKKIPALNFKFFIPDLINESEINLLTDELVDIELKHFLERKEITEEIKQEVYYTEMVRRGYIDIIGRKE